jgi:hypothetical protein
MNKLYLNKRSTLPPLKDTPADSDDLIGKWFAEMQHSGEHMGMRFGRVNHYCNWIFIPHWQFDGISAFRELLREQGHSIVFPELRLSKRPRLATRMLAIWRQADRIRKTEPWRPLNPAWASVPSEPLVCSNPVTWNLLSLESTDALDARARALGISTNSLLLWGIDQAARSKWLPPNSKSSMWLVPVNMRGGIKLARESANHVSWMDVQFGANPTSIEVHEDLRQALKRGDHWGALGLINLTARLGRKTMQKIIRKEILRGVVHAGVFSNLGSFGNPENADGTAWLGVPQATRKVPIAAGAICWNGRLGLTIQAHPMMEYSESQLAEILRHWINLVLPASKPESAEKRSPQLQI